MNFEFDEDKPIYKQLIEKFKLAIITNYYKSGDRLPSVRDLAMDSKVNPNTIQRALAELESEGLIFTKRTLGKFVTEDQDVIVKIKQEIANSKIETFISDMQKLHITAEEVIRLIEERKEKE